MKRVGNKKRDVKATEKEIRGDEVAAESDSSSSIGEEISDFEQDKPEKSQNKQPMPVVN